MLDLSADWELPECFDTLRRRQERTPDGLGTREFIRVLRLLEHSSLRELADAVDYALDIDITDADSVRVILEHRREEPVPLFSLDGRPHSEGRTRRIDEGVELRCVDGGQPIMSESKSIVLLKHHLKSLRLPTMESECEKIASRAANENLDHLAFLLQLVELEMIERERRGADRRLKAAKFAYHKSLDEFDFTSQPTLKKPLVLELLRGDYLDARENILLVGNSGTGKTHVATALGIVFCFS